MKLLLVALLCGLSSLAFADQAAILKIEKDACDAYLRGNAAYLETILAPDFVFTDSFGTVNDRAAELAEVRAGAIRYTTFRNRDMRVRLHGDGAVVTGRTRVKGMAIASRKPVDVDVAFTDVFTRIDGRWRLLAGHVSRLKN